MESFVSNIGNSQVSWGACISCSITSIIHSTYSRTPSLLFLLPQNTAFLSFISVVCCYMLFCTTGEWSNLTYYPHLLYVVMLVMLISHTRDSLSHLTPHNTLSIAPTVP